MSKKNPREERVQRIQQRNQKIREDFRKMASIKEYGVQKHSAAWIIAKLADQYFLAEQTVREIMWGKGA